MTPPRQGLRRIGILWLLITALLLLVFAAFEGFGAPVLGEAGTRLRRQSAATAALGVSLLVIDVVLPVASSVVMVALGSLFGVIGGTVLSSVGGVGSLLLAAALGRRGRAPLDRALGDDGRRAAAMVERYGMAAVLASRPIPLLAESTAIVAGATGMPWWRLLLAGTAGTIPVALVYAIAGDRGSQVNGLMVAVVLITLAVGTLVLPAVRQRGTRSR